MKSRDFTGSILELTEICKQKGLCLIVRDWPIVNFMTVIQNNYQPPYQFLTVEALKDKCNVAAFAFVRDAIDVFLSQGADLNSFSTNYLRYVKAIVDLDVPVFKFEDFCRSPQLVLKDICVLGEIDFSESFRNFPSFPLLMLMVMCKLKENRGAGGIMKLFFCPGKEFGLKKEMPLIIVKK